MPKSIVIVCAHPDDEIFGPGGAAAKWAREGAQIISIIYSYGHLTHPHFKDEIIAAIRAKEAFEADKFIGGGGVLFLGLREGRFTKEFAKARPRLESALKKYAPDLILTHSSDDPHPDHRACANTFLSAYDRLGLRCPVYSFHIWNVLNLSKRYVPRLVVDTSKTFGTKIAALKLFESQITPFPSTFLNALLFVFTHLRDAANGLRYGHHFAEVFYKIR